MDYVYTYIYIERECTSCKKSLKKFNKTDKEK